MKAFLIVVGMAVGGMFVNNLMSAPVQASSQKEVIYGHRVGPDGNMMLVTK